MGNSFVHLHVHTDHSFLDGCARVDKIIARVKELGMPAIAMTDHGNMCGAIDFYMAANAAGIKPLVGIEAYVIYDHKMAEHPARKRAKTDDIGDVETDVNMLKPENFPRNQIHHKTLIAKNYDGFLSLAKITSESYERGMYYKPRVDIETLAKYSKGIIGLSGCINGVASQYLLYSDYEKAREATGKFVDIFGKENYFIEVQNHALPAELKVIPGLFKLAKEFGLKVVATNDTHYVRKEDASVHDEMLCIQTNSVVSDTDRMRYPNNEFYIKTRDEMAMLFPDHPEVLDNTIEVAEMVENLKLPYGADKINHYPKYEKPIEIKFESDTDNFNRILDMYVLKKNEVLKQNGKNPDFTLSEEHRKELMKNGLFLFDLAKKGLTKRYGVDYDNPTAYIPKNGEALDRAKMLCDKLDYELSIIIGAGFVDYFLIVYDFINWARNHGIPVGPGRGSGAGCMVAYCLKITDIEPIRFNLLFERMLSLERVSPPDFDVDFSQDRRDEVIGYVRQKYGADRVSNIITFNKLGAKAVVRDLARVNSIPYDRANEIAKKVPDDLKITLQKAVEMSSELRDEIDKDPAVKHIFDDGKVMEGMIRNTGKHACGIIIGDQRLDNLVPMMIQEGTLTTQFTKTATEEFGLLKADFLGLKTLTVISDAEENVRRTRNDKSFDIENISLDDPATYKLLNSGNTVGVFQLESEGMRNLCRRISLSSFEEIIALIALYRPGPMQFIDQFIEAKHDPSKMHVPHPLLKDLVTETYGILVYQEQVMMSARIIAGYTLGEADILRRAMGKKKPEVMAKQKGIFVKKAKSFNNIEEKEALEIFGVLEKFAQYGFNKSHSAAYAMLSYRTAYLKTHHPVEFMAALLSSELGNSDKVEHFIEACDEINIRVLGPDINVSRQKFTPIIDPKWTPENKAEIFSDSAGSIRFGLAAIKGIGDGAATSIVDERDKNGEFKDIFDFVARVGSKNLNRRVMEGLILSGAFDSFGLDRAHLLNSLEAIIGHTTELEEDRQSGQINMFDMFDTSENEKSSTSVIDTSIPTMSLAEKLKHEKELLRLYVSGHPMAEYSGFDEALECVPDNNLVKRIHKAVFRVCGVVSNISKRITKETKKTWCFFTLSGRDPSKTWQINMYSDCYDKYISDFSDGDCICVTGEMRSKDGSEPRMSATTIDKMSSAISQCKSCEWIVDASSSLEAEHFVKRLAHLTYEEAPGTDIKHILLLDIGNGDCIEAACASDIRSGFNPESFRKLRAEPAVEDFRVRASPPKLPERDWKNRSGMRIFKRGFSKKS